MRVRRTGLSFGRRRSRSVETHVHICSWRVAAIAVLVIGIAAFAADALWHPWVVFGPFVDIALAIGGGAAVAKLTQLELSPEAVITVGGTCRWEDLEIVSTRFDDVLRTKRGISAQRIGVVLRLYGPDWRRGPIGDDMRAWAPGLLQASGR